MNGCDILLFGTMGEIGPVVRERLSFHGLDAVLVDFGQNTQRDSFGYRRLLSKTLQTLKPKVIMPVGHPLTLSEMNAEKMPVLEGITVAVETPDKIRLLDSKTACSRLAGRLMIRQPHIYTLEEALNRQEFKESSALELIFKREKSFGGSGVYRPKNLQSLENLSKHEPGSDFLIEDYIKGEDVSVDCLRKGDYFVSSCYRTTSKKQGHGPSVERIPCTNSEIEKAARTILDAIGYNGICGMDFKVDAKGDAYFLECNPRFCGGVRTQIESGFDLPFLLYKSVCGLL